MGGTGSSEPLLDVRGVTLRYRTREHVVTATYRVGFEVLECIDLTPQLGTHYARVRQELLSRREEVTKSSGEAYVERMLTGLQHWVDGAQNGYLAWGILHFRAV